MPQRSLEVAFEQRLRRPVSAKFPTGPHVEIEETVELLQSLVRVLVVDDFEPWNTFVHMHLGQEPNLQIIGVATDGLDAIQKVEALRPDLILLDIGLPKLNGFEAARQIREVSPESTILFVSGESDPDMVQEAFGAGGLGFVLKSETARDLLAAIESVLQGRRFVSGSQWDPNDVT
jgi:DNA-binding NarL/FixJ family response regulator